jgi:hypothetical protein
MGNHVFVFVHIALRVRCLCFGGLALCCGSGIVAAQSSGLLISSVTASESGLTMIGSGGLPGAVCYVVSSPDLGLPVSLWAEVSTNVFALDGTCTNNVPIDGDLPNSFFRILEPATSLPGFAAENHSATDGAGPEFNGTNLLVTVSGANTLLIAAWHAEYLGYDSGDPCPDPGDPFPCPYGWRVEYAGVPGTVIADTNGYSGGDGNRSFRTYYWVNPPPGENFLLVTNDFYDGPNELAVSAILLTNAAQTASLGVTGLDVSTDDRTGESETVTTTTSDLVVHIIADRFYVLGTLGSGETSRSIVQEGHHPTSGDASLWILTKPGESGSTTVSSTNWASGVINGVALVVHGSGSDAPAPIISHILR